MLNFSDIKFVAGAATIEQIPINHSCSEIAFIGRSNVGKSSLINSIVQKDIARVSKSPGRTQQINFFSINSRMFFVDLPGYGYASVSKSMKKSWNNLIFDYLKGRVNLKRAFLLIDSRHGFKKNDFEVMKILDDSAVVYQIILTKIDKAKSFARLKIEIEKILKDHSAAFPDVLTASSEKNIGIPEIRKVIESLK